MLKFLFKVLVICENLDEALVVKVQPKFGWLSHALWYLFKHKFSIICTYENECLLKWTNLKELPLMIKAGYRSKGNIDFSKVEVKVE